MTIVNGGDLVLKLLLFAWFSYSVYSHFSRSSKEPIGTTAVKLTSLVALVFNTWLFFPLAQQGYSAVGLIATFVSAAIFGLAIGSSKAAGLAAAFDESTSASLLTRGIYRLVRHPFYLSYIIYWMSWCLSLGFHGLPVAFFLALLVLYLFSIRLEEQHLERRFGAEYREYRKQTAILIPYIL